MKCPTCGAWTDVAETRQQDGGHTVRRARLCANGHRFQSYEVVAPIYRRSPPTVAKAMRAIAERIECWRRDVAIAAAVRAGARHAEVAASFNLCRQAVSKAVARQVRACRAVTPARRTSGSQDPGASR